MITLRADELPLGVLAHVTEPVELLDTRGEVIGTFTPNAGRIQRLYGGKDDLPDLAELERQVATAGPGCTTRELFQRLLPLTADPDTRAYLQGKIDQLAARNGCPTP